MSATSVPGLLAIFQNEWDALMLETFTLKEHLATTRTVRTVVKWCLLGLLEGKERPPRPPLFNAGPASMD